MSVPANRPHYVYRHFAPDGELLYVGVTCNPDGRPYVRRDRPWVNDATRVEVAGPMSMWDAYRAEFQALKDEDPAYNTQRSNAWIGWMVEVESAAAAQWTDQEHEQAVTCTAEAAFASLAPAVSGAPHTEVHRTCVEIRIAVFHARATGEVLSRADAAERVSEALSARKAS